MKTEHETRARNALSYIFNNQSKLTHSWFVRGVIITAEAEGSFEERFTETVRRTPVIYDSGLFSLDARSLQLRLFLRLFLHW